MSNYQTETEEVTAKLMNQNFIRKIEDGHVKEAAEAGTSFIRSKMRENSFTRSIITPETLTSSDLDRDAATDDPKKIVDIEPDSRATWVPFKGMGEARYFSGPRYEIYFGKVESERFQKSKFQLMSYNMDIRQILSDNSVKDMADQEDLSFITRVNAALPAGQILTGTGLGGATIRSGIQNLLERRIPVGKLLMTKVAHSEILDLQSASVGDLILQRHYDDGVEKEERLWGIPVVTTIKNDIVTPQGAGPNDNHSLYFFGPENYLGNFFLLQDATLFMKQEADIIQFHSYESVGIGIGNTGAMCRVDI